MRALCRAVLVLLAVAAPALRAQGAPVGFEEIYALAPDRSAAVATLIPGSDDWYYYRCRERQDVGDFAAVTQMLPPWIRQNGRTRRVIEIENRQALLTFDTDPASAYAFLRQRLGLTFDHQRSAGTEQADLPTRLDPAVIAPSRLTARALQQHDGTVDGFEDRALAWLAATDLSDNQLHSLLNRLGRPDVPNLPALIVRDLSRPRSQSFGSLRIHRELRLEHLEECARLRPSLLQEPAFVEAWLARLQPGADTEWLRDPAARGAQLARLWAFAQRLSSAHNSLKAHVLYHWLQHDLTQGAPDKDRFLTYIRLPRRAGYVAPEFLRRHQRGSDLVNVGQQYPTRMPPVGDDEALVRACLEHFFAREDSYEPYAEFLHADWLKVVFAETKILLGQGSVERWYAMLGDPGRVERLEQRVEIDFPPTLRMHFAAGEPVVLAADVKNVPTLLVKVFAIDAYRYHVEKQKEVDATIELDGLVASVEQTHHYAEPALQRVRRRFELPILREPGTYVVELVGNGISSRAVVHKGFLRHMQHTGAAGHVFRVYDEAGLHLPDAGIWFGGREYDADDKGEIVVPFSTDPGTKNVVLRHGERSTLARFDHRGESYTLDAPSHLDREAIVAGGRARLVVRPVLRLAGRDIALSLLTDPVLSIVATDRDGLAVTQEVRDPKFTDDREFVHPITVPERLASLQVSLRGNVRDLGGKTVALSSRGRSFAVNGVDGTPATGSALLVRAPGGYLLELLGKNGEPKARRPVVLRLYHRDYRDHVAVTLQTDDKGRIGLGALPGIERISLDQDGSFTGSFDLYTARVQYPAVLLGLAGETLRVPYQGAATSVTRQEFSLLAHDRDAFSHLTLAGGFLELRDLLPGDYVLWLHGADTWIPVSITAGRRDGDWLLGRDRMLEGSPVRPLHVAGLEVADGALRVRLANAGSDTRVVVVATRYQPAFDLFGMLRMDGPTPSLELVNHVDSSYHAGRKLGDEYRYVLERRFAAKYPGNMLRRPSLLLNPWAQEDSWNEAIGLGGGAGGRFGARGGGRRSAGPSGGTGSGHHGEPHPGLFANLDFLPRGSVTVANLVPDRDGVVRVPLADLGDGHLIHVLAVDGDEAVYDTLVQNEKPLQPRPRHLATALDASQHFIEQRRIEFVQKDKEAVLGDARSAQVEVYDSLASVHRLLLTISGDASLAQFAFLLNWPQMARPEKLELYTKHACHELHFFLSRKDPEFFREVVQPFLVNKVDKTFLDHWLLGDDLRHYLDTWAFAQLNLIEQILLAQRLGGTEREAVARLCRERFELRPTDRALLERLFDLALGSDALGDAGDAKRGLLAAKSAVQPPAAAAPRPQEPAEGAKEEKMAVAEELERQQARPERDAADKDAPAESGADDLFLGARRRGEDRAGNLAEDAERRKAVRNLYRAVPPTQKFVEHNYWHRGPADSGPGVVAANAFWRDFATAAPGTPFVSEAVNEVGGSFLEMMFALAVLDLPFQPGDHQVIADGDRRTLRPATPLLLVRKEVARATPAADLPPLLLGENFYRLDDRYQFVNGERRDRFVADEFLLDVAYGCQVVVTNPTSQKRTVEVLLQIPARALPVQNGFWTKGVAADLEGYATRAIDYAFYFPATGDFAHYPAQAAENGRLAASATGRSMHVVAAPSVVDTTSWEHVSQHGSAAEVMTFLEGGNVLRLDLDKIAWRLRDRGFFGALLPRLRARHVYQDTAWSYGILHADATATKEYLCNQDAFLASCGAWLDSPLVDIDPVERRRYWHVEFDPLVHARAHRMGKQHVIGNADLARQYRTFLDLLGYRPRLDDGDWLEITYYLLLQDRIEDALAAFPKVDVSKLPSRIQYDYLSAYLCFYTGETQKARRLSEPYREHPVQHWRQRFTEVLGQLDEAEGKTGPDITEPLADALAATAPSLELKVDGRRIAVDYRNLGQCEVRYYALDVEFAFSAQPFAPADGAAAAFVRPNLRETRELPAGQTSLAFDLPQQFHTANVLIEVRGGGLTRSRTFFANALAVRFLESYGQVAVAEAATEAPQPRTYVKVFARLPNGAVRFHKDGYTDIRGRFDYASLSNDPNAGAERYAVLVLSERLGATIREVAPPMQ